MPQKSAGCELSIARLAASLAALATAASAHAQLRTIYVDASAPAGGDGASWNTAFRDLQLAISQLTFPTYAFEVRVAHGVYRPGEVGQQDRSFVLDGISVQSAITVSLLGGFAGRGAANPDLRDPAAFVTVLSGDLAGNDSPNFQNRSDNARTVLKLLNCDHNLLVDGFTVSHGGTTYNNYDAGGIHLFCYPYYNGGRVRIANCILTDNQGGGVTMRDHASAAFEGCAFIGNRRMFIGGGLAVNSARHVSVTNCRFIANQSDTDGGGLAVYSGVVDVSRCLFAGNAASRGGGISADQFDPVVLRVRNCLIASNIGYDTGGGGYVSNFTEFLGCTLASNRAPRGAGLTINTGSTRLNSCIVAENTTPTGDSSNLFGEPYGDVLVTRSLVPGGPGYPSFFVNVGFEPTWQMDSPAFIDADGPDNNPLTWEDNDHRLSANSPAIDAGDQEVAVGPTDFAGNPRVVDGNSDRIARIDMGALELQSPPCPADFNADGFVDFLDFADFVAAFEDGC